MDHLRLPLKVTGVACIIAKLLCEGWPYATTGMKIQIRVGLLELRQFFSSFQFLIKFCGSLLSLQMTMQIVFLQLRIDLEGIALEEISFLSSWCGAGGDAPQVIAEREEARAVRYMNAILLLLKVMLLTVQCPQLTLQL